MQLQRPLFLAMLGVLLTLAVPLAVYHKSTYPPALSASEQAVAGYSPGTLTIASKPWQQSTLTSPVATPATAPLPQTARPAGNLNNAPPSAAVPKQPDLPPPTVSFIMQDGGTSLAIIGGAVLKEGDRYQEWRIERIERNRVLLRGRKGTTWVTMQ